jgi:hypothetical protein
MEAWELTVREQIRDTLARYNWSGDAFRLNDLADTFCEDGELEIRGAAPLRGQHLIVDFLGGATEGDDDLRRAVRKAQDEASGGRRIVRHNITNVHFLTVARDSARVASYFTVFTEIGLDHYGRYRDLFVPVDDQWLIRHRFVSTDWSSASSTMAAPPAG